MAGPTSDIIVCKFGGSSLASAAQIRKACAVVRADPARRYVVPSAPGKRDDHDRKVTDLLYACHAAAAQMQGEQGGGGGGDERFAACFALIRERFEEIAEQLSVGADLPHWLEEVRAGIEAEAAAGRGPDFAASRGEYLNGRLLAEALGFAFVDAADVISFDAGSGGRRLDETLTYRELARRLPEEADRCGGAVIPGFYGRLEEGDPPTRRIRTFGRGGSDVTGAVVARGVGARVYENWTDVSGLLVTDPRIVDRPAGIGVMTYRELRELSYMGATVLHPEAVFPVRQAGIPMNVRNTNEPDHPGTMIVAELSPAEATQTPAASSAADAAQPAAITGIAGRKDFTVLSLEKAMMNEQVGYGERVLGVLSRLEIPFEHMPSGIDTLSIVVSDEELVGKREALEQAIREEIQPDNLEIDENLALIATVGRNMKTKPGRAATLFSSLAAAGVNIRMIDQGSSELNIIVGVQTQDFEKAVRAIYRGFMGDADPPRSDR